MPPNPASPQTKRHARTVLAPLRVREATAASDAALRAVQAITETPPERLRPHRPELRIEKPSRLDGAPLRLIRVVVRDRDVRIDHDITIDTAGELVEHAQRDDTRRPLTPDEREEIDALLRDDERTSPYTRRKGAFLDIASPVEHAPGRRVAARILRTSRGRLKTLVTVQIDLDGPFIVDVDGPEREQ